MLRSLIPSMAFAITYTSASFPWISLLGIVGIVMIIDKLTNIEIG